jgi:hypothetical protein
MARSGNAGPGVGQAVQRPKIDPFMLLDQAAAERATAAAA